MSQNFSLTSKEIETLIKAGGMGPSGGNAQPWRVKVFPNKLELSLDPKRSESFIDVGKFASIFALGCFLENVEITAQKLGLAYSSLLQITDVTKKIVTITFAGRNFVHKNSRAYLFPTIAKRVTNRQLYDGSVIEDNYIKQLQKTTGDFNSNLNMSALSKQQEKLALAETLGRADIIRMTNKQTYTQMIEEFRWTQEDVLRTHDGLDLQTLEMPRNLARIFTLIHKHHEIMNMLPKKVFREISKPLIEGSSHVCCLSTTGRLTPEISFEAGRIIERIWLIATSLNLAFQPWTIVTFFIFRVFYFEGEGFSRSEIVEIKAIREELQRHFNLKNSETPLFIFRLSRAKKPTAKSLKRDWREFVEFTYPQN